MHSLLNVMYICIPGTCAFGGSSGPMLRILVAINIITVLTYRISLQLSRKLQTEMVFHLS